MVDGGGKLSPLSTIAGDLKSLLPTSTIRRSKVFAYGFVFAFVACTAFLAFTANGNTTLFTTTSSISTTIAPYRDHFNSLLSHLLPPSSQIPQNEPIGSPKDGILGRGSSANGSADTNQTGSGAPAEKNGVLASKNATGSGAPAKNMTAEQLSSVKDGVSTKNQTDKENGSERIRSTGAPAAKNQTAKVAAGSTENGVLKKNLTAEGVASGVKKSANPVVATAAAHNGSNLTASLMKSGGSAAPALDDGKKDGWIDQLAECDLFRGKWVQDNTYPLYPEGSCPHIDEPFDCHHNGRKDRAYQKLRWQPNGCNIPRLNGTDMLERLRGKRLVFVGDSLNRNMWESLVCVLRNSVKNKKNVFEESGRRKFRTEGSYSFLFKDYGCTVEFFRSPFLVQEWEMPDHNGSKKETLRLDLVERLASNYKDAHAIIFNTGHWWTHDKTAQGKDYYQEGNHVYSELNVAEAFHKALNTWAKWVDANVNPRKTHVFFRGYSASHFSGGQWNSGGQCDKEMEPIKNERYLSSYPPKMSILEEVIKGMKTSVSYMNITRMTDYRKDAHPSIYRSPHMTAAEKADIQDCSHWCLPGVPDSWNELLYAQLLIKQHQAKH